MIPPRWLTISLLVGHCKFVPQRKILQPAHETSIDVLFGFQAALQLPAQLTSVVRMTALMLIAR